MNVKYQIPKNEQEATKLLEILNRLNGQSFNDKDILELGTIMLNVDDNYRGLRGVIAMRYSEADNKLCVPFLIEAIKRNIHTKYVSSLIYACSFYDCSEHLQLFVDLLILKTDMSFVDAYYVIEKMTLTDELDKRYAINKLKAFLNNVDEAYSLKNELGEAIGLLENE